MRADISPDGSHYAYTVEGQEANAVHIVDVATGADRVIVATGFYDAMSYETKGVYLVSHRTGTDASKGLWVVDPGTGAITQVRGPVQGEQWVAVTHGAAWSESVNPADPSPPAGLLSADSLVRLDLNDQSLSRWIYRPGESVVLAGFDQGGKPIAAVYPRGNSNGPGDLWLALSPDVSSDISRGVDSGSWYWGNSVTDGRGAWFPVASNGGWNLDFYSAARGFVVAIHNLPGGPANLGGGCN